MVALCQALVKIMVSGGLMITPRGEYCCHSHFQMSKLRLKEVVTLEGDTAFKARWPDLDAVCVCLSLASVKIT